MPANTDHVVPDRYPALRSLVWNRDPSKPIAGADALSLYEANWRHLEPSGFTTEERGLIAALAERYGGGLLLIGK